MSLRHRTCLAYARPLIQRLSTRRKKSNLVKIFGCGAVVVAGWRLRQEKQEFGANLDHIVRPY